MPKQKTAGSISKMKIPASKEMTKIYERIEALLAINSTGRTRNELLLALGWAETNANKQKLKRILEMLRRDPSSAVIAVKQNQEYGAGVALPSSRQHITWKLKKTNINKSVIDAITLVTAKKYASLFLPPEQRTWLEARYEEMHQKQTNLRLYEQWHDKVRIDPRYPPIFPNHGKQYADAETIIFDALQDNASFTARYDFSDKIRIFYPVRLIRREQVLYVLCAHSHQSPTFKEYAIHRLLEVKEDKDGLEDCFTKASYIDENRQPNVPGPWGKLEEIKLRIRGAARYHFTEMRFHESQDKAYLTEVALGYDDSEESTEIESVLLTIRDIEYTYEFRTWLLGFGSNLEVISPLHIRHDLKEEISQMVSRYE